MSLTHASGGGDFPRPRLTFFCSPPFSLSEGMIVFFLPRSSPFDWSIARRPRRRRRRRRRRHVIPRKRGAQKRDSVFHHTLLFWVRSPPQLCPKIRAHVYSKHSFTWLTERFTYLGDTSGRTETSFPSSTTTPAGVSAQVPL